MFTDTRQLIVIAGIPTTYTTMSDPNTAKYASMTLKAGEAIRFLCKNAFVAAGIPRPAPRNTIVPPFNPPAHVIVASNEYANAPTGIVNPTVGVASTVVTVPFSVYTFGSDVITAPMIVAPPKLMTPVDELITSGCPAGDDINGVVVCPINPSPTTRIVSPTNFGAIIDVIVRSPADTD